MSDQPTFSRRRLLKTLFCSSVAMRLNLGAAEPAEMAAGGALDFLVLGDWGTGDKHQRRVARQMARYAATLERPSGMFLLGDNFYGPLVRDRWKSGFSQPYPASVFPGPCWAILGNHDYNDTPGGELLQLNYAASLQRKTRWTMPGKHYRLDLPARNPQVTFLMLDTNWRSINRRTHGPERRCWAKPKETAAQMEWLRAQLAGPRAPFTVVVGHHPVYSDGAHGDTPELVAELAPLLEQAGVHLYLCGHDHDLQHLELEGLRTSFVISGGGGAGIRQIERHRPGAVGKAVHGFSHLALRGGRLHLRHVDSTGQLVHAFSKGTDFDWRREA